MAHQVPWNKQIVDTFIREAMLSSDEIFVLTTRAMGWTVTKQAMELKCSESTVHKMIAKLKVKYDKVQALNPELPPRRFSAKETYMDEN